MSARNPHAGEPFTVGDDAIAAALQDVSVPALLCSLVHMTGDPSWIRGSLKPALANSLDFQSGMAADDLAEVRRLALPVIAAYRDGGCEPVPLSRELLQEMMEFLGCRPVQGSLGGMFFDDLQFDGADSGAITWGPEVAADVRDASPVVVIGCGESGILAGIRLAQAGLPFTIVDKNDGPGGTWWENRYPGARVDIGSHQYCYSFEPADHWSEYYCQQPELRDYFAGVVDKYGLRPYCRFGTTVLALGWDEDASLWRITVGRPGGTEEMLEARFVISAVGALNIANLPDIPGMDSFEGPAFHSARWPADLDITGSRFALLGAGASGFQIAPTIADQVESLTILQRTAQWIIPNQNYHAKVPPGEKWAQRHLPFYGRWFRFVMTFPGVAIGMEQYRVDPEFRAATGVAVNPTNAQRGELLSDWMHSLLADRPDLIEKSTPDYPPMGKRVLQDNGSWLRCLAKPNVELIRTAIERIVPNGIVTADGVLHEVDIICYATGFRHSDFLSTMNITGRGGVSLREQWGDAATAYLGITVPNFPNLFCMYGPGTNLAAGASLFYHSEFQAHYALDAIHQVLSSGASSIEVSEAAHGEYSERYQKEIGELVWSHSSITHSHYKNSAGKVFTLSPWPLYRYWEWTRALDPADYIIT
ncbi:MAG: 4-hydroxyacetophenone monooxygenase [Mycobacterium sp.]|nr:4-hydroxyacetophenone monooxygenase [Mycobacterium sp.]